MTSTFTTNKGLELPGYNDYVDSWNVPVNADFTLVDTAFGGSTLLNVTSVAGDVTLTATQYRPPQLIISGTLTANVRFLIPAGVGGQWTVTNSATGAFAITIASAAGGSNVTLPSGTTMVSCDGSISGMRLSITSTSVQRVDTFSAGTTGLTPAVASVGNIQLGGTLNIANGGTGTTTAPTSGQLLIGKNDGTYNVANLSAGSGITINNDPAGGITILASSTAGGTVTSVGLSGGTTGLTIATSTVNPIVGSGTFTLQGAVNYSAGGTGYSTLPAAGQLLIGNGVTGYTLNTLTAGTAIGVSSGAGSITINNTGVTSLTAGSGISLSGSTGSVTVSATGGGTVTSVGLSTSLSGISVSGTPVTTSGTLSLSGTLGVASGGTGANTLTGYVKGSGTSAFTASATIPASDISGTLGVSSGGTGTGTAFTAGSIVFAGASGVYSQNNSALYWDNTNKRLGINVTNPSAGIYVLEASSVNAANFQNTSTGNGVGGVAVSGIGVNGNASSTAAGAYGAAGSNVGSGGGSGAVGVSSGSGGYAFRSLAGGYSPFTGCHDGFILKTASPLPGDLLVDGVVVGKKLSDVITEVSVSTAPNQPVIGIFVQTYPTDIANVPPSLKLPDGSPDPAWYVYAPTHNLAVINGVGEGCMNVVGEGGNIQKGDLLVASSTPGKGMKQADDIMRGYTVARAREDAVFAPGEEKQIACIYLCG